MSVSTEAKVEDTVLIMFPDCSCDETSVETAAIVGLEAVSTTLVTAGETTGLEAGWSTAELRVDEVLKTLSVTGEIDPGLTALEGDSTDTTGVVDPVMEAAVTRLGEEAMLDSTPSAVDIVTTEDTVELTSEALVTTGARAGLETGLSTTEAEVDTDVLVISLVKTSAVGATTPLDVISVTGSGEVVGTEAPVVSIADSTVDTLLIRVLICSVLVDPASVAGLTSAGVVVRTVSSDVVMATLTAGVAAVVSSPDVESDCPSAEEPGEPDNPDTIVDALVMISETKSELEVVMEAPALDESTLAMFVRSSVVDGTIEESTDDADSTLVGTAAVPSTVASEEVEVISRFTGSVSTSEDVDETISRSGSVDDASGTVDEI